MASVGDEQSQGAGLMMVHAQLAPVKKIGLGLDLSQYGEGPARKATRGRLRSHAVWHHLEQNNVPGIQAWIADRKAHIDDTDYDGRTALIWCAKEGHGVAVELLIRAGARMDVRQDNDWNAMMLASANGHKHVVDLLTKNGCVRGALPTLSLRACALAVSTPTQITAPHPTPTPTPCLRS
jgi:hypothetical protein